MKDYIKKFKELWAKPRYKALIKLGLWFIFIGILVGMVRTKAEVSNIGKTKIESYEVVYNITCGDEKYSINGIHYKKNEKLTMDSYTYYYVDNILNYQNPEAPDIEKVPFSTLEYNTLKEKLSTLTKVDETTYTDKKNISYLINDGYFNLSEEASLTAEYHQETMSKVTINTNGLLTCQIEVEYKNFNTITNLDINI